MKLSTPVVADNRRCLTLIYFAQAPLGCPRPGLAVRPGHGAAGQGGAAAEGGHQEAEDTSHSLTPAMMMTMMMRESFQLHVANNK